MFRICIISHTAHNCKHKLTAFATGKGVCLSGLKYAGLSLRTLHPETGRERLTRRPAYGGTTKAYTPDKAGCPAANGGRAKATERPRPNKRSRSHCKQATRPRLDRKQSPTQACQSGERRQRSMPTPSLW